MKGERPCLGVSGEPSPPGEPGARTPRPAARSPHSLACAARRPSHFTARD